jgi:hypothetical protein
MVRSAPEDAYELDFMERLRGQGHLNLPLQPEE